MPTVRIHDPVDDDDRVTLGGHVHPRVAVSRDLGRASDDLRLEHIILSLRSDPTQSAVLQGLLQAIQDPASPRFGQRLSAQEFERQFGVSDPDLNALTQWLTGHGLVVDEVPAGKRSIIVSGTVAQIRAAFRTEMHFYQDGSERHLANASEPQIPDALSGVIQGIVSLHDFRSRPAGAPVRPAPSYTSGSSHMLAPADFKTIYNLGPLAAQSIDGAGRSIAILGRTNIVLGDIQQFRSTMGLPVNDPQIIFNGTPPARLTGDEGESDLDLEWAGAVAPAATIKFVSSASTASTDGIDLSAQYAVSNDVADIISLSYGLCESALGATGTSFYDSLWQQATAQRMTVFVSSGDSGAAGCDAGNAATATKGRAVNGLCSSPYATCVGGTQFDDSANPGAYWAAGNGADLGSALSYVPELVWNESGSVSGGSGLWASGGGASIMFSKPAWQSGPGVPGDGKRDVPDVALSAAAHDGYLVFSSDNSSSTRTLYVFGGTSASAPSFAGLMALVDQKAGARQGHANPRLYQLAALQSGGGPAYFHAVGASNNSVPGVTGFSAPGGTGPLSYNQATGLGSVDGSVLVDHWADVLAPTTTTLTASAASAFYAQDVGFTATVSGAAPTGSVQFQDAGSLLGPAVALSAGVASISTGTLASGSHLIVAIYSGDSGNNTSLSASLPLEVKPVVTTLGLSSSNPSTTLGQSVTFTASLTGKSVSGTLRFMDGSLILGTIPIVACPVAFTTPALGSGTHDITVVYSGDANNLPSTSAPLAQTVVAPITPTSTTLVASAATLDASQALTLAASVSGAAPSGNVQFLDGGVAMGGPVALNAGAASLTTSGLSVGSHTFTAAYAGDAANGPSVSAGIGVSVAQVVSAVALSSSLPLAAPGQSVAFTAAVSGLSPTGTVQFRDGASTLGVSVVAAGLASLTTSTLAAGTHRVTAAYSGDSLNSASVSAEIVQTIAATASAPDGDVPLPPWAAGLLGLLLAASLARHRAARFVAAQFFAIVLPGAVGMALWLQVAPAQAAATVLAGWDFHGLAGGINAFGSTPLAPSTTAANLTVGGLTRGSGVGTTGTATARAWGGNRWTDTSATAAVAGGRVATLTLAANSGWQVSISAISRLDYRRSSAGPSSGVLQVQVGSSAFADVATLSFSSTSSAGASLAPIDLSAVAALQNVAAGTTITFRIVNYGGTSNGGTWYLYDSANSTAADLEISGTVAAAGPVVDGVCGAADGLTFPVVPGADLCASGTASAVTGGGPWSWSCPGTNGGRTASCAARSSAATGC